MGFFGIKTPADLLKKLESEYERFQTDSSDENLYNFFLTANHLKDYLKNTNAVKQVILDIFASDQDIRDGKDPCDKAKHHTLTGRPNPTTWTWTGEIGGAPIGMLAVGAGDKRIMFSGSREIDVDWLADRVMLKWRGFFTIHGLL